VRTVEDQSEVVSVAAFCMLTTFILYSVLKHTIGIRVTEEEEVSGLDLDEHGMAAYNE